MRPLRAALRPLVVTSTLTALLVGGAFALPSSAADGYTDQGSASLPAPVGLGVTDTAFVASCPAPPDTQGVDGWVFTLPTGYTGGTASVVGGGADVAAYVYDDTCAYLRTETDPTPELAFTVGSTDRFLSVFATDAAEVTFDLAVTPAADPDPTATATPTPSATPSPVTRARHPYSATPNDPLFAEQPFVVDGVSAGVGQWGMQLVRAPQAWQEPRATGAGVQVAVLDSGLDLGHPDFACEGKVRVTAGATPDGTPPTDLDGHGTHVAGIVGACTDNGTGVVGLAPDATILPFRVLGPEGGTADDLAAALRAATDAGAHVINMSLGFGIAPGGITQVPGSGSAAALLGAYTDTIDPAVQYAVSKGVVVVAAAGNESFPLCGYPALAEKVVCVGATDRRDLPSWYSNFALKADGGEPAALVAPGGSGQVFCDLSSENILSTYARDLDECDEGTAPPGYRGLDGTSMASPHVAGAAALVYDRLGASRSPENADRVVQALTSSAVDLGVPGFDPQFGSGRLDVLAAVRAVEPVAETTGTPARATTLTLSAPSQVQRTDGLPVSVRLVDQGGAAIADATVTVTLGASRTTVMTGPDGTAATTLLADAEPGQVELSATYAGTTGTKPSGAHQLVTVEREDTALAVSRTSRNGKDQLVARLADADSPAFGVAGATVVLVDAKGTQTPGTTDPQGRVTWQVRNAPQSTGYEVRYAGDGRWLPSSART